MHESIVFCSTCTMSLERKFTFAVSSPDKFLVLYLCQIFNNAKEVYDVGYLDLWIVRYNLSDDKAMPTGRSFVLFGYLSGIETIMFSILETATV